MENGKNGKWGFLILGILSLLAIWFGWFYFVAKVSSFGSIDWLGQLGDSFGVLNSLLTGLAFIGVATTILLQRRQITLQQEQIRNDKAQIERQIFENNFYQLLNLVNQIADTSRIGADEKNKCEGRLVFQELSHIRKESFHQSMKLIESEKTITQNQHLRRIRSASHKFYKEDAYFTRYYQTLYQLVKFVDQNNALKTYEEKKDYIDIIRTQIARYELFHLFFYCLDEEEEPFKILVQKYGLLKDVNFQVITNSDKDINLHAQYRAYYEESAYQ